MSFFRTCLEELSDFINEDIKYRSLSHRLSRLDNTEYAKIMNDKSEKQKVSHEENIKKLMGL